MTDDFIPVALSHELCESFEVRKLLRWHVLIELAELAYRLDGVVALFQIEKDELGASGADGMDPT